MGERKPKYVYSLSLKVKRGQLIGQPFVYIFIILVAALILFFGIRSLVGIMSVQEDVEYSKFVNAIEQKVNSVYSDSYGSVISLETVIVPKNIKEICFINRDVEIDFNLVKDVKLREFIELSYSGYQDENVFFASDELRSIEIDKISIGVNPLCDSTLDRRIDIKLTNNGNDVLAELIE